MARKHNTLLFGVICVLLFILFVEARKDPQVSLTPIFPIGVANFGFWELRGSAVSQGDKIRLTRSDVNRVGSISSSANITKKTFFEASLKFSIFNTVLKGGEGIAFWLTSEQNYRLENNFGGPDTWKGIQVAFNTQGRYGADSSTVSLHTNDGTKKFIPQVIQTYKDTIVDSCNFNFRSESSPKSMNAYILIEDNYFHLFLSADNGGTWNKCITKAEVDIPNEFYLSLTASTGPQFADIHDIYSLSVSSSETFDGEEEGFLRPPMTLIGHYITQNREKLIDQFLFGDDEDVEDEMVDLEVWFKSQLESLKLTVGGQVVELNIGLDEINQNSVKLQDRLAILSQANTNLVQNCNKLSADVEQYLHSEKVDTSYTPVNTLQNNLKSIETLSTSISNAVYSIQQNQNRRTSSKRRENKKVEKWLSDIATYLIFGLLIIAVIGILVFIVTKFTRRNSPRNAASPSWAF